MFVTIQDLLDFTGKVSENSQIERFLKSAIETVVNYLGYNPEETEYTEKIQGDDGTMLDLSAFPISLISAFSVDGRSHDVAEIEVTSENRNRVQFVDGSIFSRGSKYSVTYKAGYPSETVGGTTVSTVPEKIKIVTLQIACLYWESAGGNLAVSSTSFADTGTRVFNNFTSDRFLKDIAEYKIKKGY